MGCRNETSWEERAGAMQTQGGRPGRAAQAQNKACPGSTLSQPFAIARAPCCLLYPMSSSLPTCLTPLAALRSSSISSSSSPDEEPGATPWDAVPLALQGHRQRAVQHSAHKLSQLIAINLHISQGCLHSSSASVRDNKHIVHAAASCNTAPHPPCCLFPPLVPLTPAPA